jgi:hypothetical protein
VQLDLSNNQFSGGLPKEWGAWGSVRMINLMNNGLSQSVPAEWASGMSSLQRLVLNGNSGVCGALPQGLTSSKVLGSGTLLGAACP